MALQVFIIIIIFSRGMGGRSPGLDQRMLQWRNLGMIGPGPGSLVGEMQSPQRRRRGRSESPTALRRSGNVVLQHKVRLKDTEYNVQSCNVS